MLGTGANYPFLAYRRHAVVARLLEPFNIGGSDLEPTYFLLFDREEQRTTRAQVGEAHAFLKAQHLPPPELTPYEQIEADRLSNIFTKRSSPDGGKRK